VFDALVHPHHLAQLEARLRRHPALKCVIDHGAKPSIAHNFRSAWSEAMCSLARNTSAYCKLSGLVTEAGDNWVDSDITPYAGDLIYHFGADRLLWGSDWPVLNLASNYSNWFDLARKCCARLSDSEIERVFGLNAAEVYGLEVLCLQ
jgi:L-fuconolactonase